MKTIWKYKIPYPHDEVTIPLPHGAKVLYFGLQKGLTYIWVLVDTKQPTENRLFRMVGTGHDIPDESLDHIGTIQMSGGNLVWHLFEVTSS